MAQINCDIYCSTGMYKLLEDAFLMLAGNYANHQCDGCVKGIS